MDLGIEFDTAGECLEFIDICVRNLPHLEMARSDFDYIHILGDPSKFLVVLRNKTERQLQTLQEVTRLPIPPAPASFPAGYQRDKGQPLNAILAGVRLIPQRESPCHPLAVVLYDADPDQFRACYTELLQLGCRELRVGLMKNRPSPCATHVIFVERPPQDLWLPAAWRTQAPAPASAPKALPEAAPQRREEPRRKPKRPAKRNANLTSEIPPEPPRAAAHVVQPGTPGKIEVYYRQRAAEDCKIYVQWGYAYPYDRLERLYDFGNPLCRLMFLRVEAPWLQMLDADFRAILETGEQALTLKSAGARKPVALQPLAGQEELSFEFRVVREARSASAPLEAIEADIGTLLKAVDDLQRDHYTSATIHQDLIYLAYVFEQERSPDADTGAVLCPALARFLDRPMDQLRSMRYGFFACPEDKKLGYHFVLDDRPAVYRQVLTTTADDVYIQREPWREWNLPLYVRKGDDLRPRLEDPRFERLVRKMIWEDHKYPIAAPVLLRADDDAWQAWCLTEVRPLIDSDCLNFLHGVFPAPIRTFQNDLPDHLAAGLRGCHEQLAKRAEELEQQISALVKDRIDRAMTEWQRVDREIADLQELTRNHESAVKKIRGTITALPGQWNDFVGKVLKCHAELVEPLMPAWKAYAEAHKAFDTEMAAYQSGQREVVKQVAADKAALVTREKQLDVLDTDARKLATELAAFGGIIRLKQEQTFERVRKELAEIDKQLKKETERLDAARAEVKKLTDRAEVLRLRRSELKAEQTNLERLQKEMAGEEKELADLEKTLTQRRAALTRRKADLPTLKAQLARELGPVSEQLISAVQHLERMSRLRDQATELERTLSVQVANTVPGPTTVRTHGQLAAEILKQLRQGLKDA